MKTIYKHIYKYKLLYLGLLIHLFFYISVAWTNWPDIFFSGPAAHDSFKGIDFYQLPRGAWAFWHGGSLTGAPLKDGLQYAKESYYVNTNVYHPLFTLTLGSLLALFDPAQSPYIWLWIKLAVSLLASVYFFWTFRESKHVQCALFVLLANFSVYMELVAWQFHFVLNIFLLLFLITLTKKHSVRSMFLYWLGMLVKPVGVLFAPALICKGRWKIGVAGLTLFVLGTGIFRFFGGDYYIKNLIDNILYPETIGPDQIITLNALLRYSTHWPDIAYNAIQYTALAMLVFLSTLQRIHISKLIFLCIVYFLCFYRLVYEYDWSTLAYVIAVCIVCCPAFQTRLSTVSVLLICLPSCFVLLTAFHFHIAYSTFLGLHPDLQAWQLMVISKLVPLMLLCISVLYADVVPIYKQISLFIDAMVKVNESLQIFGEDTRQL